MPSRSLHVDTLSGFWTDLLLQTFLSLTTPIAKNSDWQNEYVGNNINVAAPWPMRWRQIAPQIALAYLLSGGLVLRRGAGAFTTAPWERQSIPSTAHLSIVGC